MKCKQCNQKYDAKRSTSLYCSPKCKQEYYRNRMAPVTVAGVTLSTEPVTLRDTEPVTVTERIVAGGVCWCCGNDIPINTICCGPCSWSGEAQAKRAGRHVLRIGDRAYEDMITESRAPF